ncbi:hypothetical protein NY2A_b794R [Paramecium bursaria Chlorella virus NY2A]|uniref:Uncharacterized protein b794R n=1 Tax=Paramecium bursaria Chlorella virus NY2A TaxID=46021 RepID=A7IXW9_PBCVN|nr:hypothetical protein NY2A_b794R [Paramecium bursaria Chlorella virus NY2A]ABT15193.1 hypothetical protein NY2A_b794R [Paramecium bursaria Chlorella virus NY2A]
MLSQRSQMLLVHLISHVQTAPRAVRSGNNLTCLITRFVTNVKIREVLFTRVLSCSVIQQRSKNESRNDDYRQQ